jgi:hypothetical protein
MYTLPTLQRCGGKDALGVAREDAIPPRGIAADDKVPARIAGHGALRVAGECRAAAARVDADHGRQDGRESARRRGGICSGNEGILKKTSGVKSTDAL